MRFSVLIETFILFTNGCRWSQIKIVKQEISIIFFCIAIVAIGYSGRSGTSMHQIFSLLAFNKETIS